MTITVISVLPIYSFKFLLFVINFAIKRLLKCDMHVYFLNLISYLLFCVTDVLFQLNIIPRNYIATLSAGSLMAVYEGQTKQKTRAAVVDAIGGVFFLDEAYSLVKRGSQGYGPEALDELMFLMDDPHNPVMILAGYEGDMENLIKLNEGMKRRVKVVKLKPFTDEELVQIIQVCGIYVLDDGHYTRHEQAYILFKE